MHRRSHIGLASLALTLIWTGALFGVFVGGKIGQHPSLPVTLALSGALCAVLSGILLTLACFPGLGECLRAVGQVAAAGATLESVAIVWTALPTNDRIPDLLNELEFSNFLLLPSMIALLASSVLYFIRFFSGRASRVRFEPQGSVQSVFLTLRRHHRILGWLGLAFAGAHSVYYLLIPGQTLPQWTGIAATAILAVAGLLGLITSYNTFWRLWIHRILGVLLMVALTLHWGPFLPTSVVFLLAVTVAGFVHVKLVGGLVRLMPA
ncbi:MAG TPA: hypothetical protein VGL99_10035 [Chloroflexota bacterium]